jgi:hypothetical protein
VIQTCNVLVLDILGVPLLGILGHQLIRIQDCIRHGTDYWIISYYTLYHSRTEIEIATEHESSVNQTRIVDPDPDSMIFVDPDPDPWARKMKKKCTFL